MTVMGLASLLTLTFFFTVKATSQTSGSVPDSPCRRFGHQAAILNDTLYVDGGWVYDDQLSVTPDATINQNVTFNSLSQLTSDSPTMPQPYRTIAKSGDVPSVAGGVLWPDEINEIFWLYGGEFNVNPKKDFQLWGFDTRLNQWNLSTNPSIASSDIKRTSYGAGATLPGKGYHFGGYQNSKTTPSWSGGPVASSNLIEFDMQTGQVSGLKSYNDGIGMAEGVMVAIPASAAGMLIYFGGVSFPNASSTETPLNMSQVLVYDIGDNAWFVQTTTGDIPANRRKFCAGMAAAQDSSSYNIYLYGGFGFGANATGFDDVYILSLPTFTWIKWSSMSYDPKVGNPHGDLTCTMVGTNQMIVMGGNFTAADPSFCDVPKLFNQHNLVLGSQNTTAVGWNPYSPAMRKSKYYLPDVITNVTGGSSTGGATNNKPANWDSSNLSKYFAATATFAPRSPTRPAAVSDTDSSKSHIGAIAGGAAGGGVALIIAAVLLWYCCVKKRKSAPTRELRHGRPQHEMIAGELNADPNRYSKVPTTFSTVADSTHHVQSQPYPNTTSPPPGSYHHPAHSQSSSFPTHMMQQGYGPIHQYPQQYHQPMGGSPPTNVFIHRPDPQTYSYPPPDIQRMSPSRPYELDARGGTPGTHHVQQLSAHSGHRPGMESVSDRSGGDFRLDSASQSTQSPINPSWKG